jgi:transposase
MNDSITWVGMDVHKESLVVIPVGQESGRAKDRWEIPHTARGRQRLLGRLRTLANPRCVYEAGPCGYDLSRFLEKEGIPCDVVAPSLIPTRPGDRIKTDRRDAEKLARMHRAGELTTILVPPPAQEALRDLVRAREDVQQDVLRRRHRLLKFLLRHGQRFEGASWTKAHWAWLRSQKFADNNLNTVFTESLLALDQDLERAKRLDRQIEEQSRAPEIAQKVARLKTLRGIDTLTAMTLLSELVDVNRFASARELMAFVGLVPSEHSSGPKRRRGSITKTGNAHVRRVLVESAWHYRHAPRGTSGKIRQRRQGHPPELVERARKAELRLHGKYVRMVMRGKPSGVAAVAVARELAGFVWDIGRS